MGALTTYAKKSKTIRKEIKKLHSDLLKEFKKSQESITFHWEYVEFQSQKITKGLSALESIINFVSNRHVQPSHIEGNTILRRVGQVKLVVNDFVSEVLQECEELNCSVTEEEKTAIKEMIGAFNKINGALMQLNIKSKIINGG